MTWRQNLILESGTGQMGTGEGYTKELKFLAYMLCRQPIAVQVLNRPSFREDGSILNLCTMRCYMFLWSRMHSPLYEKVSNRKSFMGSYRHVLLCWHKRAHITLLL